MRSYEIWYEVPTAGGRTITRCVIADGWDEAIDLIDKCDELGYNIVKIV